MVDPESEINYETQTLQSGERVTIEVNGVRAECVVVNNDSGTCLVPLDNLQEIVDLTANLPAQINIHRESSESIGFVVTSETFLKAITGKISTENDVKQERQWFRIRLDFEADISIDGQTWRKVNGENISEGGLLISVMDPTVAVAMEQNVDVRMHLPECEIIAAHCVVKRVFSMPSSHGRLARKIALEFSQLKPEDSRHLTQFVYKYQVEHAHIRRL